MLTCLPNNEVFAFFKYQRMNLYFRERAETDIKNFCGQVSLFRERRNAKFRSLLISDSHG